jgi:hypothetical protein
LTLVVLVRPDVKDKETVLHLYDAESEPEDFYTDPATSATIRASASPSRACTINR